MKLIDQIKPILTKEYFISAHPEVEAGKNQIIESSYGEFLEAIKDTKSTIEINKDNELDIKFTIYLASTIFNSCTQFVGQKEVFEYSLNIFEKQAIKNQQVLPAIVHMLNESLQAYEDGSLWHHLAKNKFPKEILFMYDPRDSNFFQRKGLMQDFILSIKKTIKY